MLQSFGEKGPRVAQPSFVAGSAVVIGDVAIGRECSIWYGAVIRGDLNSVTIGDGTSVQENSVIHVDSAFPVRIGRDVTIGHMAMLHGCAVGDRSLIGIGSIVLDGAEIGEECMIGAGALVAPRTKVPPRSLVLGVPGKVVRQLGEQEVRSLLAHAREYWDLARRYLE